jgi:hypothetical protein
MYKNDILDNFEECMRRALKSVIDKIAEFIDGCLKKLKDFLGHYEEIFDIEMPKIIKSTEYYRQNVSIKYNYIPVFKRNLPYQRRSY